MDRVQVYILSAGAYLMQSVQEWMSLFSPNRQQKIAHYYFQPDRVRTVLAELLVRWLLAGRSGLGIKDIYLQRRALGKPYWLDGNLSFNLSHSGSWIVCSIGTAESGVDVEAFQVLDMELAQHYFCPEEYQVLQSLSRAAQMEMLLKFWTLKESFLKYTGEGLSRRMDAVDGRELLAGRGTVAGRSFRLPDGAWLSICTPREYLPERLRRLEFCPERKDGAVREVCFTYAGDIF